MELECSYRERVPFASFTVMPRKQLEDSFEDIDKKPVSLSTSEVDLRALAKALSKIKLMNDIEPNPGPSLVMIYLEHTNSVKLS